MAPPSRKLELFLLFFQDLTYFIGLTSKNLQQFQICLNSTVAMWKKQTKNGVIMNCLCQKYAVRQHFNDDDNNNT